MQVTRRVTMAAAIKIKNCLRLVSQAQTPFFLSDDLRELEDNGAARVKKRVWRD